MVDHDKDIAARASAIRMVITDCDGVLTDAGVYYSARGEELKRFSMRDGMGVERLMSLCGIPTAIITGEESEIVRRRAGKLKITELHCGIRDKVCCLQGISERYGLSLDEMAYMGDDYNDLGALGLVGLPACPADALPAVKAAAFYVARSNGGYGAFRELAELIIESQTKN